MIFAWLAWLYLSIPALTAAHDRVKSAEVVS
jgi:hypothetical protein